LPKEALGLWAAAFAVRAAYTGLAVGFGASPASDSVTYDTVAWNLAQGHGFSMTGAGGPYPTAFVPPVVPYLVSLLYRAAGHHYGTALLAQCAVGALLPLALAALGRSLFGPGAARLAGWLAAFHPLLVFFNAYLLTETTFTVVLTLALLATAAWVKTPTRGRAFGAGLLWGMASLTRPTALLLPGVLLIWAWRPVGLSSAGGERLRQAALLLGGGLLCVAPWTMRNAAALGGFVPVTTGGGRSLLDSNNPVVLEDPSLHGNAVSTLQLPPYAERLRGLSEREQDARSAAMAWDFLREHRADWARMAGWKLGRMWRFTAERGTTGTWQAEGSPLAGLLRAVDPLALVSIALLPFLAWGTVIALRGPRRWYQSLPLWVAAYFSLIAVVFWGSLRTRLPVEPLLVLLAAVGLDDALRRLRRARSGLQVVEGRGTPRPAP
jgi:hypothetical protein